MIVTGDGQFGWFIDEDYLLDNPLRDELPAVEAVCVGHRMDHGWLICNITGLVSHR